jgi:type IV pilus assembly protein PilO
MATQKPAAAQAGSALDRLPLAAKIGLGAAFVALLGVVYFLLFFSEVDGNLATARAKKTTLEQQLAQQKSSQEAYQKDLEEKAAREQRARDQKKLLPDDAETPAFLSGIQGVATIAGVNLTAWSPMADVPSQFFAKVPMKLSLKGKFHQVAKFVHGVGQLDRIINIEDIKIKAGKQEGDDYLVDVDCLATAFRATRPQEIAAQEAAAKPQRGGAKK